LQDAGIKPGANCPPESVALFGATGLAGLPLREVAPLIRVSAGEKGGFDLSRFGTAGLKAVSPILSFKILANMPFCFVSINENIQGVNAIYTPWEGEGAQAIEAGIRAVQAGDANCALVGGCDVKTHELAFATLQQLGLFASWTEVGKGVVPAEGAACLMLETEQHALARGARIYARVGAVGLRPRVSGEDVRQAQIRLLSHLGLDRVAAVVSSANGEVGPEQQERSVLDAAGISTGLTIAPKKHAGDLFAAAGLLQVALGASLVESGFERVLVNCFGHGGTQAAFVLEQDQAGKPK
jgi:3-oxoacyl-(acyl-carrier-protein) synthase